MRLPTLRASSQAAFASGVAETEVSNAGSISAVAEAFAAASTYAGTFASASANAVGVNQTVNGGSGSYATLYNSGDIAAAAEAFGGTTSGYYFGDAFAGAAGYVATQSGFSGPLYVDGWNSGTISANAYVSANGDGAAAAAGVVLQSGSLLGSFDNEGDIVASATASAVSAEAEAYGIVALTDGANNLTLINSGLISAIAAASASYGASAQATGIAIASDGGTGTSSDVAYIYNNGGAIVAGESEYGSPLYRGNAINLEGFTTVTGDSYGPAPNAVVINLTGNNPDGTGYITGGQYLSQLVQDSLATESGRYGYIFGNIEITDDDQINVYDGYTLFDGEINPDGVYEGQLNIYGDGVLALLQNDFEGPSNAVVDDFNHYTDGTVVYELTPDDTPGILPVHQCEHGLCEGQCRRALPERHLR